MTGDNRKPILLIGVIVVMIVLFVTILPVIKRAAGGDVVAPAVITGIEEKSADKAVIDSLKTNDASAPLSPGNGMKIGEVVYFQGDEWAIATIESTRTEVPVDPGYLILHKENDAYKTVAGPGTSFDRDSIPREAPIDLFDYLKGRDLYHTDETFDQ